jgi:hypothetical protein
VEGYFFQEAYLRKTAIEIYIFSAANLSSFTYNVAQQYVPKNQCLLFESVKKSQRKN